MPRVSVVMASYGHERFVGAAVESVLRQTEPDWELLVSDDASPDGTADVVAGYADPRISLVRLPRNRAVHARNHALGRARGDLVAVLNSDDAWEDDKLARQLSLMESRPELTVCFTGVRLVDAEGRDLGTSPPGEPFADAVAGRTSPEWLGRFFREGNCLAISSALVRRSALELVGPFSPALGLLGDLDMWLRLLLVGPIDVVPLPLTHTRLLASANLGAGRPDTLRRHTYELRQVLEHYRTPAALRLLPRALPEARDLAPDESDEGLLLGLARLSLRQPYLPHRLLGLDILRDLLNDAAAAARLSELSPKPLLAEYLTASGLVAPPFVGTAPEHAVRLHWALGDELYAPERSVSASLTPGTAVCRLGPLPSLPAGARLRIDPSSSSGLLRLRRVALGDSTSASTVLERGPVGLDSLAVEGDCMEVPDPRGRTLCVTGPRLRLYLPPLERPLPGPGFLEIELETEGGLVRLLTDLGMVPGPHRPPGRPAIRLLASLLRRLWARVSSAIEPRVNHRDAGGAGTTTSSGASTSR